MGDENPTDPRLDPELFSPGGDYLPVGGSDGTGREALSGSERLAEGQDGIPPPATGPARRGVGEGPPRDELIRSRRARIVEAAAVECARRGYGGASVEGIAKRAGVSVAEFERVFPGKEESFVAVCNAMLSETITVASKAYAPEKSHCELVRDAAAGMLELLAAQPSFAWVMFVEARLATARSREVYDSAARALMSLIERGWDYAPEAMPRPTMAPRAALGGAEAVIREEIASGRSEALPEVLGDILYSCLVPFLGQAEALAQIRQLEAEPRRAGRFRPSGGPWGSGDGDRGDWAGREGEGHSPGPGPAG